MGADRPVAAGERQTRRAVGGASPWRDLPGRYGPWQTCYDRFVHWRRDGTWDRRLAQVQTKSDAVGEIVWEVSVDSTVARRTPSRADEKRGYDTRQTRRSGAAGVG